MKYGVEDESMSDAPGDFTSSFSTGNVEINPRVVNGNHEPYGFGQPYAATRNAMDSQSQHSHYHNNIRPARATPAQLARRKILYTRKIVPDRTWKPSKPTLRNRPPPAASGNFLNGATIASQSPTGVVDRHNSTDASSVLTLHDQEAGADEAKLIVEEAASFWLSDTTFGQLVPAPSLDRTSSLQVALPGDSQRLVPSTTYVKQPNALLDEADLIRLHKFCRDEQISELANLAATTLLLQNDRLRRTTAIGGLRCLVDLFPPEDALYVQVVQEALRHLNSTNAAAGLHDLPKEFAHRVFVALLRERETPDSVKPSKDEQRRQICSTHKHLNQYERTECHKQLLDPRPQLSQPDPNTQQVGVVDIGPERMQFTVHKALVCKYSTYFRAAFEGGFVETARNRVLLQEETVMDFSLFVNWLYRQKLSLPSVDEYTDYAGYQAQVRDKLPSVVGIPAAEMAEDLAASFERATLSDRPRTLGHSHSDAGIDADDPLGYTFRSHEMLVDLFAFADRRGVAKLRNDIITLLVKQREKGWPLLSARRDLVDKIYEHLLPNSALCRFVVDEAVWCWSKEIGVAAELDWYPRDFNADVLKTLLNHDRKVPVGRPSWRYDLCRYHDHENWAEQRACQEDLNPWYITMSAKSDMEPVREIKQ